MNDEYESFEHAGLKVAIYPDADPENPRETNDGYLGEMICWYDRYNLGDVEASKRYNPRDYAGWDALEEAVVGERDIALPLYLYDHSGLRMKVGSFQGLLPQGHAEFDSGQVGWIVARADAIRREFGNWVYDDPKARQLIVETVEKRLASEVEEYDQYLSGDVWGYVIKGEDGEDLDSCWGWYGLDEARQEAKAAAEYAAKNLAKSYAI